MEFVSLRFGEAKSASSHASIIRRLPGKSISGADLNFANLLEANLQEADLRYANLVGAEVS